MIEMKHINLSFRDKDLFTDQEIKIDSGKITLITGESGSGKSTLLFELARLTDYANKEYIYENEKFPCTERLLLLRGQYHRVMMHRTRQRFLCI